MQLKPAKSFLQRNILWNNSYFCFSLWQKHPFYNKPNGCILTYLVMLDFISVPWKRPLSGYILAELLCFEMAKNIFGERITRFLCLSSTHWTTNNSTALENQKIFSSLLRLCSSWWNSYKPPLFFAKTTSTIFVPVTKEQLPVLSLPFQQKPLLLKGHIRQDINVQISTLLKNLLC